MTNPAAKEIPDMSTVLARLAEAIAAMGAVPEGLDREAASAFIGVSLAKLDDLNARGLMPSPAQIGDGGRCPRWSRCELKAWLQAGAPSRVRWASLRDAALRRVA